MTVTYEAIASTTLTSSQATVTFSSIPSTYTDLVFITSMLQDGSATDTNAFIQLNSSTSSVYSRTGLRGNGSTATSFRSLNDDCLVLSVDSDASNWALSTFHFMNYSNTTTFKTVITRQNKASALVDAIVYLWRDTSAINAISITASDNRGSGVADKFVAGSTFSLYGIKAE